MVEVLSDILIGVWDVLMHMSPYLLFGFIFAGFLSVFVPPSWIERHLGGAGIWPIVKASAIGVPLPLCSCSVIPVSAALRRRGASKGATVSFLVSTPQVGAVSVVVMWGMLGMVFAVYRAVVTFISGVLGGLVVSATTRNAAAGADEINNDADEQFNNEKKNGRIFQRALGYGLVSLPRDIGRSMIVGLLLAALISVLMPGDYFAKLVPPGPAQIVVMMLVGIPIYVCATSSIPIAAALVLGGAVSPGAAFAFLVTGPATNAATIAMLWKVLGRKVAIVYLVTIAATAFGGGVVLDLFLDSTGMTIMPSSMWMPYSLQLISTIALIGVLGYAVAGPKLRRLMSARRQGGSELVLHVNGMRCNSCRDKVTSLLLASDGVRTADVDIEKSRAVITGDGFDVPDILSRLSGEGYDASREGGCCAGSQVGKCGI